MMMMKTKKKAETKTKRSKVDRLGLDKDIKKMISLMMMRIENSKKKRGSVIIKMKIVQVKTKQQTRKLIKSKKQK